VDQLDPERGAGTQQPGIHERRPVVDVDRLGDTATGKGGPQRGGQPDGVLGIAEPVADDRSAVVVDEGEQVGLAAGKRGAM
jgi:hypothetical protein